MILLKTGQIDSQEMKKLIVSLTFDDALDCHLDRAIPMLNQQDLCGTFFTNINAPAFAGRFPEWQAITQQGHELGNHTIFHPAVSSKDYISEGNALENYTLDRMRIELETANQFLSALDGQRERSFAYPCCNRFLGRPGLTKKMLKLLSLERTRIAGWVRDCPLLDIYSSEQDYSCLMPDMFVAARGGGFGNRNKQIDAKDIYHVPCVSGDGLNSDQLLATVDSFQKNGNWLVFMFHGIGSGHHLQCDETDFKDLIDRLTTDRGITVLPFIQAAKLVCGSND